MRGVTLKFAVTYNSGARMHVAPEDCPKSLCGAEVVPPGDQANTFRFGVYDATLCTRCRNAVLKAEDDCIYLGYDEKSVEPYLLNRYYVRNRDLTTPAWVEQWVQNMASA